ncbi:MAG: ATP-binding protein [Desulfobulbus sp.]|nr:ATP-binding protein [Desulfobulbus sp.]
MSRIYHPRSFFSLLLTGFVVVALPLIVAMVSSIQILDSLAQQSTVAVLRSVTRIDSSKKLIELLNDQERAARLFRVLKEQARLQDVNQLHAEISATFRQLSATNSEERLIGLLDTLEKNEKQLVDLLNAAATDADTPLQAVDTVLAGYEEIASLASQIERLSSTLMIEEVDQLRKQVQQNKTALMWQICGLLTFCVLLIALFIALIIRPVYQMDRSIELLGEGDFTTPILVSGPRDLEAIGKKLDWLRKRLHVLDREKKKMLAHISHELKTPLASIKEGTGLLKDGVVGPLTDQQGEVITILDNNCRKLQSLIQNILDFNMAQAREQPTQLHPIRLDNLVREVSANHRTTLLSRNIHLMTDLPATLVSAQTEKMITVIDNLLSNAIKFTPDGGAIHILLRAKELKAQLLMEDTGPGIDDEERSQIFQPFFKGKQMNYSPIKGSGLGLAISREYLQNCEGALRLLPNKPQWGARFLATIPLASSESTDDLS